MKIGQHNVCSICLPYMKKTLNGSDFLECPMCRAKHYTPLNSIPKCLVIAQLLESNKNANRPSNSQSHSFNFQHFGSSLPKMTSHQYEDSPPAYSSHNHIPASQNFTNSQNVNNNANFNNVTPSRNPSRNPPPV